jgi:hypothetical protein
MDVAKSRHFPDRAQDATDARKIRMFNSLNRSGQARGEDGPAVASQRSRGALGTANLGNLSFDNLAFKTFSTSGI